MWILKNIISEVMKEKRDIAKWKVAATIRQDVATKAKAVTTV